MDRVTFSFLTSGPVFGMNAVDGIARLPELSSPIVSGTGARSWVFTPMPRADELARGMDEQGALLKSDRDRDGRAVEVLLRLDPPPIWWLRWPLSQGCLTTHLREVDGLEPINGIFDRVAQILARVSILEDAATPLLLVDAPLANVASTEVGYQESAIWFTADLSRWLKFVRPGFLKPGQVALADAVSGGGMLRGGVEGDVELQLVTTTSAQEHLDEFTGLLASVEIL